MPQKSAIPADVQAQAEQAVRAFDDTEGMQHLLEFKRGYAYLSRIEKDGVLIILSARVSPGYSTTKTGRTSPSTSPSPGILSYGQKASGCSACGGIWATLLAHC